MQSSALGLASSNRSTCSQVKAGGLQCCHGLFQRRCTTFLPALRQQFSSQHALPLRQPRAVATTLTPRRSSRYVTAWQATCTTVYQELAKVVQPLTCFWHRMVRQPTRMCGIIGIYKHQVGRNCRLFYVKCLQYLAILCASSCSANCLPGFSLPVN